MTNRAFDSGLATPDQQSLQDLNLYHSSGSFNNNNDYRTATGDRNSAATMDSLIQNGTIPNLSFSNDAVSTNSGKPTAGTDTAGGIAKPAGTPTDKPGTATAGTDKPPAGTDKPSAHNTPSDATKNDKALAGMVQGVLENKPEVMAKAAKDLPDGTYNVADLLGRLQKSGLHVDKDHKDLLNGLQTITKKGDHFEVTRSDTATQPAGDVDLHIGKDVQFDLTTGKNPSLKNITGLSASGLSVAVNQVDATPNNHGGYDYKISHGDVFLGMGSGDVTIKT